MFRRVLGFVFFLFFLNVTSADMQDNAKYERFRQLCSNIVEFFEIIRAFWNISIIWMNQNYLKHSKFVCKLNTMFLSFTSFFKLFFYFLKWLPIFHNMHHLWSIPKHDMFVETSKQTSHIEKSSFVNFSLLPNKEEYLYRLKIRRTKCDKKYRRFSWTPLDRIEHNKYQKNKGIMIP